MSVPINIPPPSQQPSSTINHQSNTSPPISHSNSLVLISDRGRPHLSFIGLLAFRRALLGLCAVSTNKLGVLRNLQLALFPTAPRSSKSERRFDFYSDFRERACFEVPTRILSSWKQVSRTFLGAKWWGGAIHDVFTFPLMSWCDAFTMCAYIMVIWCLHIIMYPY